MTNTNDRTIQQLAALPPTSLKNIVDYTLFDFQTTAKVPELTTIVGQQRGRAAMEFGLNVNKPGYHLFVSGIEGTGKTSFVHSIVGDFANRDTLLFDWCYVNNFDDHHKPNVLQLPAGLGKILKKSMEDVVITLQTDLPNAFSDENYQKDRTAIIRSYKEKGDKIYQESNKIARDFGFIIKQSSAGVLTIPITAQGEPISEEAYRQLDAQQIHKIEENSAKLQGVIISATQSLRQLERELKNALTELDQQVASTAIVHHIEQLKNRFKDCDNIIAYLTAVQKDLLHNFRNFLVGESKQEKTALESVFQDESQQIHMRYIVNLLIDHSETEGAPIITADHPTFYNMIGKVEYENRMGVMSTDFTKVKPGYLHYANGGYLIIQAKDIFSKSLVWEGLKRALLNQKLHIENIGEHTNLIATSSINPRPIPLNVKVIIIGNMEFYQTLYHYDEDFRKLFKIRADFDVEMDYSLDNITRLASFIHTHCVNHNLLHFDRTAVAKVAEYSSRLAGHQDKLSTRFNQQVEILYEADAWATMMGDEIISAKHIQKAIAEKQYRSSLYEEKVQTSINEGTTLIDTEGENVGQVNGLAVYHLGQFQFGKPTRITVTTFVGQKGLINIERESNMSGNIHNKGVYILSGYLGQKFAQKYPLALTAHIVFEQSYGGVDGDSASSTELYALLSSLSGIPLKQGLAVTGSVNQKGEIQPIGGVNEKIEGFYEVCKNKGLTGQQGVLIPHQNVKNLMLSDEVIQAVQNGQFHIYQVKTIEEGIEILTGIPAGRTNDKGEYGKDTVYGKVAAKLQFYMNISKESSTLPTPKNDKQ